MLRVTLLIAAIVSLCLPASGQAPSIHLEQRGLATQLSVHVGGQQVAVGATMLDVIDARVHTVPGHKALAVSWKEVAASGQPAGQWYAISPDGVRFLAPKETSYELRLRYATFDPLAGEPAIPHAFTGQNQNLWIVQYATQGIEPYRDVLRQLGVEIHLFLAWHSNVVEMDARTAAIVAALPFVRWVGPFHPAYKLDEKLMAEMLAAPDPTRPVRVNILTTRRGALGQEPVVQRIAGLRGSVDATGPTFFMSATVSLQDVLGIARDDNVQWIDHWSPPEDDMDIARDFHGADYVETVGNYTGQGVRVEVMDGGCDTIHPDLQNFTLHGTNTPSAHGTCTSGIVCGTGLNNGQARGVMPDSHLVIADYNSVQGGSRYNHTAQLQDVGLSYKTVLQSNSWGNTRTTAYTSISQEMDLILFDHDRISILQSQSNAGNQDSRPQAWAKNIISIGGVRHYNTLSTSDDAWSFGASIGPAADGRIKPDLASFYDATLCTDQVGSNGYTSTDYYSSFGGTSGATPIVAGHLGLLYQMWSDGLFGNPTSGSTVFDNRPHNTTMKALLINTASQWSFSGTGHDLTRVHQGWGYPDLQKAYDGRLDMFIVDESDVLAPFGSTTHTLTVQAGAPELKVTMIYNDPPGTTSSTLHRINDLDVKVTAPGGAVYWGNNGLLGSQYSTSGGSSNTVDNVENVFIQNPAAGTWTVEVIAASINQDGHTETGAVDADYALVVSGATSGPAIPPVAEFSATPLSGDVPLNVAFTDLSTGTISSWSWTFGDGGTSSSANPNHTYTTPGTFTVELTVTGPAGNDVETKVGYVTVTLSPPDAPTGISATATSTTAIDVSWNDASSNEDGFDIERSLDGTNFSAHASVGANVTSFTDSGLSQSTTYWYRVRAFNTAGSSSWNGPASDTTFAPGTVDVTAGSSISVSGTVSGSLADTQAADGNVQSIRERESGGKPANRHSYLEHKWTFNVPAGSSVNLLARAWHNDTDEGDNMIFAWSTNDSTYSDIMTVTKTFDDGMYQSGALSASASGTVYIRVRDADRSQGNRGLDTVFIDHLYIQVQGAGGGPAAPSNVQAMGTSSSDILVTWNDNSANEDGFEIERSPDGSSWSSLTTVGANTTSHTDGGLAPSSTWHYRVRALSAALGDSTWSGSAQGTTLGVGGADTTANGDIAGDGSVTGTYLDTHTDNGVSQSIRERTSGGNPSNRISYMSHTWSFNVPGGGSSAALHLKAWHTANSEGDDFRVFYSTTSSSSGFTELGSNLINTTSPSNFVVAFPTNVSGNVWIRIEDADQTPGNRVRDTVYVDHMFIRTQ